jgi:predicted N-acetyltransferase YhbS
VAKRLRFTLLKLPFGQLLLAAERYTKLRGFDMLLNIRKETENDSKDIKSVNDKAFGQENEGKLVENHRKNEKYISDLSLVAEIDNKVVGHILFFPIKIISQKNEYETLSLAPMSVLPNYQKMGI